MFTALIAASKTSSEAVHNSEVEVRASENAARIATEQLRLVAEKHAAKVKKGAYFFPRMFFASSISNYCLFFG
jgi:hypothetical protein